MIRDIHSVESSGQPDAVTIDGDAHGHPWYSPFRLIDWMSPWLADRRRSLIVAAALAVLVTLPSLWLGWQTDDHFHRAALTDEFEPLADARRSPAEMFAFVKEGLTDSRLAMDLGQLPWWSSPNLKLAFSRPLTGLTHWLDYRYWPHSPWLMHLHSVVWYVVAVVLATWLFRRIAPTMFVAGLAAVIYAIDDGHGFPAGWLANRNGTISLCFGIAALLAHVRWRDDGKSIGGILSPMFLAASVLANEGGMATCAYLFAHVMFLDRDRTWRRFAALIPALAVVTIWWAWYKAAGYGAANSYVYIDPAADTMRFAAAVLERGPLMLSGLLGWPPSDFHIMMSAPLMGVFWAICVVVIVAIGVLAYPLLRADARLRFAACGMVLSILPACATFASNRLTLFAGIGGSLIVATMIVAAWRAGREYVENSRPTRTLRTVAALLIIVHLVVAPIGMAMAPKFISDFGEVSVRAAESLPSDDAITRQRLVIVSTPSAFTSLFAGVYNATQRRPTCDKSLVLASTGYSVEVIRTDAHTLEITPAGGWLLRPGHWPKGDDAQFVWFGEQYLMQTFDLLFRDDQPFEPGERIELSDVRIEIVRVTEDGRPATVNFRFALPLADSRYRWIYWKDGKFARFDLPSVGEHVDLPAPRAGIFR